MFCHYDTGVDRVLENMRLLCMSFSTVVGAIVLIAVVLPWFLIAVACVVILYAYAAAYYRASARELKVGNFTKHHARSSLLIVT